MCPDCAYGFLAGESVLWAGNDEYRSYDGEPEPETNDE